MADRILELESVMPLYLSERDTSSKWEVKADSSLVFNCRNTSSETVVLGEKGITKIQFLFPITKSGKLEAAGDIAAGEYLDEISGGCQETGMSISKGEIREESYLYFELAAEADYNLKAGEYIEITFQHINAFCPQESVSHMWYAYQNKGSHERAMVPVYKKKSPPAIKKFQLSATKISTGDRITVTWEALGASKWQLLPYAIDLGQPAGSLDVTIWESGSMFLRICKGYEGIQKKQDIQVIEGQDIEKFTASPEHAKYEEEVTFGWKLKNAGHAYITNGIGKVEGENRASSIYSGNSNYVLYCPAKVKGRDTLISKAVCAGREGVLEIVMLSFLCTGKSGENSRYSLNWFVENCKELQLITSDGREWSNGGSIGAADFQGNNLTLEIWCKGDHGQEIHLTQIKAG